MIVSGTFGDFSKGGRFHITIESKGNENWKISVLKLTLEFPKSTNLIFPYLQNVCDVIV